MTLIKHWGRVLSLSRLSPHPETDSSTSRCQSLSLRSKPNTPSRPQQHYSQAAESASCQIAFHFKAFRLRRGSAKNEGDHDEMFSGMDAKSPAADTTAVIHLTIEDFGEKWTSKSEQPRVNIPWCLLSNLLTQVAFPWASELVYVAFTLQESPV